MQEVFRYHTYFRQIPAGEFIVYHLKRTALKTAEGQALKKSVLLLVFIILLSLFADCIYVNPLVQAGENNISEGQTTALQICQITCGNHIRYLPLGCICPETPTPVPANGTAGSADN